MPRALRGGVETHWQVMGPVTRPQTVADEIAAVLGQGSELM